MRTYSLLLFICLLCSDSLVLYMELYVLSMFVWTIFLFPFRTSNRKFYIYSWHATKLGGKASLKGALWETKLTHRSMQVVRSKGSSLADSIVHRLGGNMNDEDIPNNIQDNPHDTQDNNVYKGRWLEQEHNYYKMRWI